MQVQEACKTCRPLSQPPDSYSKRSAVCKYELGEISNSKAIHRTEKQPRAWRRVDPENTQAVRATQKSTMLPLFLRSYSYFHMQHRHMNEGDASKKALPPRQNTQHDAKNLERVWHHQNVHRTMTSDQPLPGSENRSQRKTSARTRYGK